ncbi:glucokinase [Ignicoccus pacificus DSM 13166]|uniref:Glucokinase n=1 Tax=Ignicoccus pacificus DSM 13166 TaxID=940294 RepID=A0A977KB49_9CREN|nr:glucokinase [Ignicoccus pacificus DSM 13166]
MRAVLDIGGTKTAIGIYHGELELLKVIPTPKDPKDLISVLIKELKKMNANEISIATMGPLKISEGMIVNNPHLNEKNFELARPLMMELGVPVYMVNDCVAGAWAEAKARKSENLVYIGFGTGIGIGAVVDGVLLMGKEGNAHEFGHVTLSWNMEIPCGCGGGGHVESFLGGSNLPKFAKALGYEVSSAKEFFELMKKEKALRDAFERALLSFISSVSNAYDPEVIALSGGVYYKNKELFDEILEKLPEWKGLVVEAPRVEEAKYNDLAPLYGAAFLAEDKPPNWFRKLKYLVDWK